MAFPRTLFCLVLVSVHFRIVYCTFSVYSALDVVITPNIKQYKPYQIINLSCNVAKELVKSTTLSWYKKEGIQYFATLQNHTKANTNINVNSTKDLHKRSILCELWCKQRTENIRYGLISNEKELAVEDGNSPKDNNYIGAKISVKTISRNTLFTVGDIVRCEVDMKPVSYIEMYRIKGNLLKVLTWKEFDLSSSFPYSVEYNLTHCENNSKIFCRVFNDPKIDSYIRSDDVDIQLVTYAVSEENCDEDSCFSSSVKNDARTSFPVIWTVTPLIILIMIVMMAIFYYRRKRTRSPPDLRTENAGHADDKVLYAEIQVNQPKNTIIPERTQYATIVGVLKPRK